MLITFFVTQNRYGQALSERKMATKRSYIIHIIRIFLIVLAFVSPIYKASSASQNRNKSRLRRKQQKIEFPSRSLHDVISNNLRISLGLNKNEEKENCNNNHQIMNVRNSVITYLPFWSIQITIAAVATTSGIHLLNLANRKRKQFQRNNKKGLKLAPTNQYLRAITFWSKAGPIVAHYKFTKKWLKFQNYPLEKRDEIWNQLHDEHAPQAYGILIQFRGLFVKLGQVLSARPDFMPQQYIEKFSSLQDALPPKPFDEIKKIVEASLKCNRNLDEGVQFNDIFESFDEIPLGSASIGQVHRAVLQSTYHRKMKANNEHSMRTYKGDPVVAVKVMHPAAEDQFRSDFNTLRLLCNIALPGWRPLMEELRTQMMSEFDYIDESKSLQEVRDNMDQSIYSKYIKIPEPVNPLCTKNVLVMELLNGKKLSDHMVDELATVFNGNIDLAQKLIRSKRKSECETQ